MPSSKRRTQGRSETPAGSNSVPKAPRARALGESPSVAQTPPTYPPTLEDITRREAYVIASIAASLFDKAIGPKGSVDQATEILRLSKEVAVHLNTPKKENRYLYFR